jgi:hypothetical protein
MGLEDNVLHRVLEDNGLQRNLGVPFLRSLTLTQHFWCCTLPHVAERCPSPVRPAPGAEAVAPLG